MRKYCRHCGVVIETTLGVDPPGRHADAQWHGGCHLGASLMKYRADAE